MPTFEPWPGKWMRRVITVVLIVIPFLLIALTYYRFTDAATASDQKALQERQDCARVIANEQSTVKDNLAILNAQLNQAFVAGILESNADPSQRAVITARLADLTKNVDAAIAEVKALPPTQKLVDKRCPSVRP